MTITTGYFQGIEHFTQRLNQSMPSNETTGKLFMLNCCNSPLLPTAARLGWEVSGIGNDRQWFDDFKLFCKKNNLKYGSLIHGDIYNNKCDDLEEQYHLMISSGLFIHAPNEILAKWSKVLVKNGIAFNGVPNCYSINGKLLKKFDSEYWNQLIHHSPESFNKFHIDAGLKIKMSAYYGRGLDINMLVPWGEIRTRCHLTHTYKLLRYTASFASLIISPFVHKKSKSLNSFLYGLYYK